MFEYGLFLCYLFTCNLPPDGGNVYCFPLLGLVFFIFLIFIVNVSNLVNVKPATPHAAIIHSPTGGRHDCNGNPRLQRSPEIADYAAVHKNAVTRVNADLSQPVHNLFVHNFMSL